jgi:arabinoxylan arabinofuranohydrolase
MKLSLRHFLCAGFAGLLPAAAAFATNPLIMDQFTADPTARVFEGKVYIYPSHDIKAPPQYKGRPNWFVMEDYHVFSSENLTDWKDHGVIVRQTEVEWADPTAYAMWAPDAVFKEGKYYFYFPAIAKSGGFQIGVAIADTPRGPFKPVATPIEGVKGIDPSVLIDKDGSAYLFYSLNKIFVAKLKPSMLEIEGEPAVIANLPTKGLLEGPFVFERDGIYYLTFPHVENKTERLEYATSTSAMGPFKPAGVILDESASGCWTVHHSVLEYKGQWYLFYHDKDLSPSFDKNRAIRADKLFFNADGTIRKVVPTWDSWTRRARFRSTATARRAAKESPCRSWTRRIHTQAGKRRSAPRSRGCGSTKSTSGRAPRKRSRCARKPGAGRARDPSGWKRWAGDRPSRSCPRDRMANGQCRRKAHSVWRP